MKWNPSINKNLSIIIAELNIVKKRLLFKITFIFTVSACILFFNIDLVDANQLKEELTEIYNVLQSGNEAYLNSKYQQAEHIWLEGLELTSGEQTVGHKILRTYFLKNIGFLHYEKHSYSKALQYFERSLTVLRDEIPQNQKNNLLWNLTGEIVLNIGNLNVWLGNSEKLEEYAKYLKEIETNLETHLRARVHFLFAKINEMEQKPEEAIKNYENTINYASDDIKLYVFSKINIGTIKVFKTYDVLNGLLNVEQAVTKAIEHKDAYLVTQCLSLYGLTNASLGFHNEARRLLEIAMLYAEDFPHTLPYIYSGLESIYATLNFPQAAIFYGKKAVNSFQYLRLGLSDLDRLVQKQFNINNADVFNNLCDLLMDQQRLLEARKTLIMIKEEEYYDYVVNTEVSQRAEHYLPFTEIENVWNDYIRKIAAEIPLEEINIRFEDEIYISSFSVLHNSFRQDNKQFFTGSDADDLQKVQDLFSTFMENVVFVQLFAPSRGPMRILLSNGSGKLFLRDLKYGISYIANMTKMFRQKLVNKNSDILPLAKELYDKVIAPIEGDLKKMGARTLLISSTGAMRYLPLGALHDGEVYLAQKYGIATYTAAARDKLNDRSERDWRIAAMGVSKAADGFSALQAVPVELDQIVKKGSQDPKGVLPGEEFLNENFTRESLSAVLREGYPVIHIASHFRFDPAGTEEGSFLLLGNGERLSVRELDLESDKYPLAGVDLLTLSACETAMTAVEEKWGREIEGLGTLAQKLGARSVLATLWKVSDPSTARFMELFYSFRESGVKKENGDCMLDHNTRPEKKLTKAEALSCAQRSFIRGEVKSEGIEGQVNARTAWTLEEGDFPYNPDAPYSHPYYWAPFILMGNFL